MNKTHLNNLAIKVIFWWKSRDNGLAQSPDIATGVSQTQLLNPSTSAAITASGGN